MSFHKQQSRIEVIVPLETTSTCGEPGNRSTGEPVRRVRVESARVLFVGVTVVHSQPRVGNTRDSLRFRHQSQPIVHWMKKQYVL